MKCILILGSEGFIGSHLVKVFSENGYNVFGGDLFERASQLYEYFKISRLSPELDEIFSSVQFDVCINAAGSGNVPYSMTHPMSDFEANTLDTIKVLDTIRRFNTKCKYIHISSAAVYGNPKLLPIVESSETNPLSSYGWHKLMSEHICKEYFTLYNIPVAVIRPFSVYGKGLKKQLFWDLCSKMKKSESVELFGTGSESRDFIHVSDLCLMILLVAEKDDFTCNIYNAAGGVETTIKQVASIFEEYHQNKKRITFNGVVRKGDPLNWQADISKIAGLGFSPTIDLKDASVAYIDWFETLNK